MATKTNEKKQQAQFLYMAGNKTQKEIAGMVGVCERTVHSWIHQYAWDKLRLAAFQAPVTIADNLAAQIVELQNVIAGREVGNRFPTPQEAEVSRKIIASWEKMKKYPSLSVNMQVLETFRNFIRPIDKGFAEKLAEYTKEYIEAKAVNGYAPYQVEYGVDQVSPVMPGYDEVEGLETNKTEYVPCPDYLTCLYPGRCNYPYCMKEKPREVTVDNYKVSPVLFTRNQQQQTEVAPAATRSNSTVVRHSSLSAEADERRRNSDGGNNVTDLPTTSGFNRDRFMDLLKKLRAAADSGISDRGTQLPTVDCKLPTATSRSNPAISTSEDSKNTPASDPQNVDKAA